MVREALKASAAIRTEAAQVRGEAMGACAVAPAEVTPPSQQRRAHTPTDRGDPAPQWRMQREDGARSSGSRPVGSSYSSSSSSSGSSSSPASTGGLPCMLELLTDDSLLSCAEALQSASDLACLALTCRRFSNRCIAAQHDADGALLRGCALPTVAGAVPRGGGAPPTPETRSIVEEVARRWLDKASAQERGWVPRKCQESWLSLLHEVEELRRPLAFGRAHDEIQLSQGRAVAAMPPARPLSNIYLFRAAASATVMRAGWHYAQFTVVEGDDMFFGVIRPGWDVELEEDGPDNVLGHCFYDNTYGTRWPGQHEWGGQQGATEAGDRIGLLLDLDAGSMSVYKNDARLGVMQASGLSGEYCWAVALSICNHSVRIDSAPLPPPPSTAQLKAEAEAEAAVAAAVAAAEHSESDGEASSAGGSSSDEDEEEDKEDKDDDEGQSGDKERGAGGSGKVVGRLIG
eukprot:COSAG06_NODE_346_length_17038_cov_10.233721_4_plen_460_part_00